MVGQNTAEVPAQELHTHFNKSVHGARGLFAFAVFVFHVVNSGLSTFPLLVTAIGNFVMRTPEYGVELFLCISGYVIAGTLCRAHSPAAFFKDRVIRIYPTLWATIFVIVGIGLATRTHGFADEQLFHLAWAIPLNLLALPGILPLDNIHPAAWSLSYEMAFYLFCAVCWATRRHFGSGVRWIAVPAMVVLIACYPRSVLLPAGILVARGWPRSDALVRLTHYPLPLILLFLLCWRMVQELSLPSHIIHTTMLDWSADARLPLALLAIMSAMLGFAGIVRGHGLFGRVLCLRPFQYLGTISYSFYLWHPIVMSGVKAALLHAGIPQAAGIWAQLVFFIAALPPALAISHASQRILERGLAVRLRRWLRHDAAGLAGAGDLGAGGAGRHSGGYAAWLTPVLMRQSDVRTSRHTLR